MQSKSPERKALVKDLKYIAFIDWYSKSEYHKAYCRMYYKHIEKPAREEKKAKVTKALEMVNAMYEETTRDKIKRFISKRF